MAIILAPQLLGNQDTEDPKKYPSTFTLVAEQPKHNKPFRSQRSPSQKQVDLPSSQEALRSWRSGEDVFAVSASDIEGADVTSGVGCASMAIASQDSEPGCLASDEEASCGSFLGSAQCLAGWH
jgi:hypothetical protein